MNPQPLPEIFEAFWSDHTGIGPETREFAERLAQEAEKYENVFFLDFYSKSTEEFTDALFYDLQHLNRVGSEYFTEIITRTIFHPPVTEKTVGVSQ